MYEEVRKFQEKNNIHIRNTIFRITEVKKAEVQPVEKYGKNTLAFNFDVGKFEDW
jgi:hypothetical protein